MADPDEAESRAGDAAAGDVPSGEARAGDGLGRRGWVLVAALVVAFLLIPATIVLVPPDALPFRVAYLAFPFVPALVLGVIAVWSAVGSRREGGRGGP